MKNVRKRFLSLIMAMMMVLSCVATASAADVADTTSTGDDSVVVLSSTDGDEGIMPLSTTYINHHAYSPSNGSHYIDSFTLSREEKVVTEVIVLGTCQVRVTAAYNGKLYNLIDETITNAKLSKITIDAMPRSTNITVNLTFSNNTQEYSLRVWGE